MKNIKTLTVIAVTAIMFVTKAEAQKQPPPPPPPVPAAATVDAPVKVDVFLKNNPTIKDVYQEKKDLLIVKLKNGTVEKYNMADINEKKKFADKYGDLPAVSPPPPPPPVKAM